MPTLKRIHFSLFNEFILFLFVWHVLFSLFCQLYPFSLMLIAFHPFMRWNFEMKKEFEQLLTMHLKGTRKLGITQHYAESINKFILVKSMAKHFTVLNKLMPNKLNDVRLIYVRRSWPNETHWSNIWMTCIHIWSCN